MLYAVHKGRSPGVYLSWDECRRQVEGFVGNKHKSFKNRADAEYFAKHGILRPVRKITGFFLPPA